MQLVARLVLVGVGLRFSEVMAAGVPQVVFGDPGLLGEHRHLAERLRAIPVAPPPYWELKDLLKAALAP